MVLEWDGWPPLHNGVGWDGMAHCQRQPSRREFRFELIVDVEEEVRVLPGVIDHLVGEGADPPVRKLVSLISSDAAICLQEVGEGKRRELELASCLLINGAGLPSRIVHLEEVVVILWLTVLARLILLPDLVPAEPWTSGPVAQLL